jgi:DNA invertase Pin-like site-specific DNA recombinase
MRVAIYYRTSKRDQHPEMQKLKLLEYANKMGYEYELFEERESTRKTRPVKEEVLKRLRQRDFDGVLIYKLDRWARSLPELVLEVQELIDKQISFISINDAIDLTTATGRLYFHILSAFAQFERDLIRERTLDGLDRARADGKICGRHRLGCKCGNCKQKKTPSVNREESTREINQEIKLNQTVV